ncbi:MAG TPA: hypothetical protein ENK35_07440 [Candidatus Tenderia sp.]|nr:hypothetical protein [Candidatus Tenderia sp.]
MTVKVLETQLSHIIDALHWLDGSTRHMESKAQPINELLDVEITHITAETGRLKMIRKPGTIVFHRPDLGRSFPTHPDDSPITTEAQRKRPEIAPFTLKAVIRHPQARYNPRQVNLDIGSGKGHSVWLYPALHHLATSHRAVFGSLRFDDQSPARWALLVLDVEYAPGKSVTFHAQADANGDFELPLQGLPPMAKGVDHFKATLAINAGMLDETEIPDPDNFTLRDIAKSRDAEKGEYDFEDELELALNPNQRTRLSTAGSALLFIKQDDD